ncbi:MAG: T9SS type A sorting domain-containing protein [Sphingobacteriales bacterium]|nr:MAG: T9SS type A sorting domain-containing protein [Sphingobacteriales bacterium]
MKRLIFTLLTFCMLLINVQFAAAQIMIQGNITDCKTLEPLAYANIIITDENGTDYKANADSNGLFKIKAGAAGKYNYRASYLGYENNTGEFEVTKKSSELKIQMLATTIQLDEVVITVTRGKWFTCWLSSRCCFSRDTIYSYSFDTTAEASPAFVSKPTWYELTVFPNPTQKSVQIMANQATEEPLNLQVFDAAGRLINQQQLDFRNQANYTFDLSAQKPGNYFFRMQYMGETHTEKIIKIQ